MVNVSIFKYNEESEQNAGTNTWMNIENILKGKKPYRKGQPDHIHLVSFKSIKVTKLRESISNGSKKRKVDRMEKDMSLGLGPADKNGSGPVDWIIMW